jgi:hypothetical protein
VLAKKGSSDDQASSRSFCCVIRDGCGNDGHRSPSRLRGHLLRSSQQRSERLRGNSDTSCEFAISTAEAYWNYGKGSQPFSVYSPVTGQTYTMTCTNAGSVCQGGNNAVVYLRR